MGELERYIAIITSFKRGGLLSGPAPNKPILLLTLIEYFEKLGLAFNEIPIDNRLYELFEKNWNLLVPNKVISKKTFTHPLHHFGRELGWQMYSNGKVVDKLYSSTKLLFEDQLVGKFDPVFFRFFLDPENCLIIKLEILLKYFSGNSTYIVSGIKDTGGVFTETDSNFRESTSKKSGYVRNLKFNYNVLAVYNATCAISRMKVIPNSKMVQACHIEPHSKRGNNKINNGLALCGSIHQAFDSGLISLGDDYEVLVKPTHLFSESNSPFRLRQFEGQRILLPENKLYWPDPVYLGAHRKLHRF